jgi:hypothetical protein
VQRRCRAALIELAVAAHRRIRGQALDLDVALLDLRDDGGVRAQPTVGADAKHESLGQFVEHVVEVLHRQRVALAAPPIGHDPAASSPGS